ncbi:MAG TPA: MFS transporter [Gemmatimonadaceae bacterium]|nr:MFS transporter [Gemmatimonadaceae bacterium]
MSISRLPCEAGAAHSTREAQPCSPAARRGVLVATILASSMTFIDGSVVNATLPVMREQLGASPSAAQWIIESYMLFLSSLLLVGGALGDRWGRRVVFILGTAMFAAASAWCGLAPNVNQLIVARGGQGVGAALLVPGSLALISATFPTEQRGRAIGTWAALTSIAAGIGPLIGGWLADQFSWRWIFFLNLPLAVPVIVIALAKVPESRGEPESGGIDWLGALLATAGLFALVIGLVNASTDGFSARGVIASLTTAAVLLLAFVAVEYYSRHPMMPLVLFRSRTFTAVNLLTLCLYAAFGATTFVLPFTLIQLHGYTVVGAAAALLPFVAVMALLSRWAGWLSDRYGPHLPLSLGPTIAAVGLLLFARAAKPGSYWVTVLPGVLTASLGMAISVAPLTTTVMSAVSERHAGIASGINNATSRVAILVAVACAGILTGDKFATGLPLVSRVAAVLALLGAVSAAVLIRAADAGTGHPPSRR